MKWSNLKLYKCPNGCGGLFGNDFSKTHSCPKCNFRISNEKFNSIVSDQYSKKYVASKDNLEELNNLGHDKLTEDFSDSPHINL